MYFRYVAKDPKGRDIRGSIEALDERALVSLLRSKDLSIISIQETQPKSPPFAFLVPKKRVPLSELVIFSRQMATVIEAGIPLVQALEMIGEQTQHRYFKKVIDDVRRMVMSGSSLSQAFEKAAGAFSELFISMVRAGEQSGSLDEILDRVAVYMEKSARIIRKVKSAMTYPSIVISLAVGITLLLMVKVIPVFKTMYEDFGAPLPGPTTMLINISMFLKSNIGFIFLALVAIVFILFRINKTPWGGLAFDHLKLKIPIFGIMLRKVAVAKFTRTLSTLLRSGVPILQALEITAKTAGNRVIEKAVLNVRNSIREGENIAEPLKASEVFPPLVVRMVSVGEKTGELEKMLNKIADFYEEQVEATVEGLTSIIEPIIIAFLGIVIGTIVICMFLPIFSLAKIVTI